MDGPRRRQFLAGAAVLSAGASHPYRIAFANANETPGSHLEGLGFTGADVRRSFELAARTLPLDIVYYDNAGDPGRAIENAEDAVRQKVDLLIEYNPETSAASEIARKLNEAGIPVLAINYPAGGAPLYTCDHHAAGAIAGRALGSFAKETWSDDTPLAIILGDLGDPSDGVAARIKGVENGLGAERPSLRPVPLDTGGQPRRAESLIVKYLAQVPRRKVLIATLDDLTALSARDGIAVAARPYDCVIVSHGLDRSIHGGANEKKEIDPTNRASAVLGSVAYYLDRYGYEVLPLAMRMLRGETVPARTVTRHVLIGGKDVFRDYPPTDMN